MGIREHNEPFDQQTEWVAPRLVPLSALDRAEVGVSLTFPEFSSCDVYYAPAS